MKKRKKWTTAEWIAFGNRVKDVRSELMSMIRTMDQSSIGKCSTNLWNIVLKIDKWKSDMENLACSDVPRDKPLCHIFYGEKFPNNNYSEDGTFIG